MMKDNQFDIPFQVQTLIDSMKNKKDGDHIRANFRMRLVSIRDAINKAIEEYDNDVSLGIQYRGIGRKGKN